MPFAPSSTDVTTPNIRSHLCFESSRRKMIKAKPERVKITRVVPDTQRHEIRRPTILDSRNGLKRIRDRSAGSDRQHPSTEGNWKDLTEGTPQQSGREMSFLRWAVVMTTYGPISFFLLLLFAVFMGGRLPPAWLARCSVWCASGHRI